MRTYFESTRRVMPRLLRVCKVLQWLMLYEVVHASQSYIWKEKGTGLDCSITCGVGSALSGPVRDNSTYVPYLCAVNGSNFGSYNTGVQTGTLIYVANVLSCWVYSTYPGGASSTPHSDWYCLCGSQGNQILNTTGSTSESCSTTCSGARVTGYDAKLSSLTACQQPKAQPICFNQYEHTFGYQDASAATDHSCLFVSPPATILPQTPPATRALSFDCLCLHPNTSAGFDITPNCTTSSFDINKEPPTPSPTLPPSQTPVTTVTPRVSSSNSNSAGVLAGSVIGALVGTLLLLIAALLLWRRSRATRGRAGKAKITRSAFASYGELNTDHSSNLDDKHQVHLPSYRS